MLYIADFFAWREEVYIWMIFCVLSYIFFLFATNFVIIVESFSHFPYVDGNSYTLLKLRYKILNRSKYKGGTISKLGISFLVHWYK